MRLKRLAKVVEAPTASVAVARLIASTGASTRRYATLSAGTLNGVATGQPVRSPEGLVGRVVAVGRLTARVLLITDGGNVVPVKRIGDGMPALANGLGDGTLEVRALEAGSNPFRVGDIFATSGAGGVYPPDVPVAIVRRSNREVAIARPFADPNRLDFRRRAAALCDAGDATAAGRRRAVMLPLKRRTNSFTPPPTALERQLVPVVSTMLGSMTVLFPVVATEPLLPPFGLMFFLGWRLLRGDIWPLWAGLFLGAFDDLFSGQPIGTAMCGWTIILLAIDALDRQATVARPQAGLGDRRLRDRRLSAVRATDRPRDGRFDLAIRAGATIHPVDPARPDRRSQLRGA